MYKPILILIALGVSCSALSAESPAVEPTRLLARCRAMLPTKPVVLTGSLVLRNRRGIVRSEYDYRLTLDRTKSPAVVNVSVYAAGTTNLLQNVTMKRPGTVPEGRIRDTDVTWLDLALDCLWWQNARVDAGCDEETVHGQSCDVIRVDAPKESKALPTARLWIDRKNGCLMQVEQLDAAEKPVRRLWGTRIKKFGERWMANVLEVETLGSGRRTKITVEKIEDL